MAIASVEHPFFGMGGAIELNMNASRKRTIGISHAWTPTIPRTISPEIVYYQHPFEDILVKFRESR